MAYDGWIEFGGVELVNLSRTAQLAEALGIDTLWTEPGAVQWIETANAGLGYGLLSEAPWHDPGHPASSEFAGIVPLSISGLDDSSLEATTVEYITHGGTSGKPRNKTQSIVANVAIIASTSRGADFGKRWLDRVLRGAGGKTFCAGSELTYFRYPQRSGSETPPKAHRRDVVLTRGTSVTRKRESDCSATWLVTFTWTANDPFEYGEEVPLFVNLGATTMNAPGSDMFLSGGVYTLTEQECPVYDYSPIYDPLHPALVPAPTAPDFYPDGWELSPGVDFYRHYAKVRPVEPSVLGVVPVVTLRAGDEARMVRVSVWPGDAHPESSVCDPLWQAVVTYAPAGMEFVIDGEQEASYVWDGASPLVRRTDSLVYGPGARPIEWASFNDPSGLLVTFDFRTDGIYVGNSTMVVDMSVVPRSD